MKKIIYLLLLLIPFIVSAKEYCDVVSGNGKDIGDEIACGSEHFYIVDSNDNEIKMLAKYNLNVGESIYKEKIKKEASDTRTDDEYCSDLAREKGGTVRKDSFYNAEGYCFISISNNDELLTSNTTTNDYTNPYGTCRSFVYDLNLSDEDNYYVYSHLQGSRYSGPLCIYRKISKSIIQSDMAISAHWDDNNNYSYPQVGDIYITGSGNSYDSHNSVGTSYNNPVNSDLTIDLNSSEKYDGYFWDLNVRDGRQISYILKSYENYMGSYDLKKIDLLSLDDINKIIIQNNKSFPYETMYFNSYNVVPQKYEFAFLQDYLLKKHDFLFGTTYWIRTGLNKRFDDDLAVEDVIFINSRGGICGSYVTRSSSQYIGYNCNYGISNVSMSSIGAGIRPVVTIPNELKYLIKTKTDGNGTIDVVEHSLGGETIQFKVIANKGYKLDSIVIKTNSGEEIDFSEGEITKNDNGTISIDKNKFTMPFENINIEATFISSYKFIEGMNQKFNIHKDTKLRFRLNMEYEDFIDGGKIFIDNKEIDCACYEITKGSTVITFKDECTKKLSAGKHEIIAKLSDGASASTNFTISESIIIDSIVNKIVNPNTGDKIILVVILFILSIVILRYLDKKKKNTITL